MLNLPSPHNYGTDTILNSWMAAQDRRSKKEMFNKEFKLREDQFGFNKKQAQAAIDEKTALRQTKAADSAFKFIESGGKLMGDDKTYETGIAMSNQGYTMLTKVFPDMDIDVKNITDAVERRKEFQKQLISDLDATYKRVVNGDKKAIADFPGKLAVASKGGVEKEILDFYIKLKPETLSPREKAFSELTPEEQKKITIGDSDNWKPKTKEEALELKNSGGWKPKTKEEALELKNAGGVKIDLGGKGLEKLNEKMAANVTETRKEAEGAVTGLANLYEAKKLINSGIITGTGAEYITSFGNFLYSRLGFQEFKDPVENTQAFASTMGTQVGQIIKQFGSGTGLSDADREYAQKIVGGEISLTEGAIKKLMAINEKAFKNVITNYNKIAKEIENKPGSENLLYKLSLEMPEESKTIDSSFDGFWEE